MCSSHETNLFRCVSSHLFFGTGLTPALTYYKWTKILSLEIDIFGEKMMAKSGLEFFYFEIPRAHQASKWLLTGLAKPAFNSG